MLKAAGAGNCCVLMQLLRMYVDCCGAQDSRILHAHQLPRLHGSLCCSTAHSSLVATVF